MASLSYKFAAVKPIRWSISNPRVPVQLHLCSPVSSYFGECFSHCWKFTFFARKHGLPLWGGGRWTKNFRRGTYYPPLICVCWSMTYFPNPYWGDIGSILKAFYWWTTIVVVFLTCFLWLMTTMMMFQDRYLDFHEKGEMRMKLSLSCWIVGKDAEELVNSA